MAIPIAARLVDKPLTLGTLQFREFAQTFTASPSLGVKPFTGPVVILTDEGTASTAEIFAAGLQEAGRALVVGDTSLGAVLPSQVESLPGGAVIQYVVADFKTPKGVLLEGRGVQPNRRVVETRAACCRGGIRSLTLPWPRPEHRGHDEAPVPDRIVASLLVGGAAGRRPGPGAAPRAGPGPQRRRHPGRLRATRWASRR